MREYDADDDMRKSIEVCYQAIRDRVKAGGPSYSPPEPLQSPSNGHQELGGLSSRKPIQATSGDPRAA
jgi:hypothetical protein